MPRGLGEIERLELLGDGVQASQRPAVVVLVVALDQLERKPVERPRTAVDLLQMVAHVMPPFIGRGTAGWSALGLPGRDGCAVAGRTGLSARGCGAHRSSSPSRG